MDTALPQKFPFILDRNLANKHANIEWQAPTAAKYHLPQKWQIDWFTAYNERKVFNFNIA